MNDKTEQLLRELANKLGTTTEYLWGVMVKQAYVEAWAQVAVWGVCVLLTLGTLGLLYRWRHEMDDDTVSRRLGVSTTAAVVLGAMSLIGLFALGARTATTILYPEGAALRDVVRMVR